jgi:hypothetical protein
MTRRIRQVELDDRAFAAIESMRQENGMTQKQVLARIIEWVTALDGPSQQLVLGRLPAEYASDAAARLAQCALGMVATGSRKASRSAAKRAGKSTSAVERLPSLDALKPRRRKRRSS